MQLGNHLGNVLVTISDRKKGVADPLNAALIKFFEPVMLSGTDYYPFGMPMRIGGDISYRYGFNGQEMSNEIKGLGNSYTAEFWEYDPRIGRRWNLDPKPVTGVGEYSSFNNNPILHVDIKGDSSEPPKPAWAQKGPIDLAKYKKGSIPYEGNIFNQAGAAVNNWLFAPISNLLIDAIDGIGNPATTIYNVGQGISNGATSLGQWSRNNPDLVGGVISGLGSAYNYGKENWNNPDFHLQVASTGWGVFGGALASRINVTQNFTLKSRGYTAPIQDEFITVYRNFGLNEYKAFSNAGNKFTIGENFGSKQFWLDQDGLDWWKSKEGFRKPITAVISVKKVSLNYGYEFKDAGKYRAISYESQDALNMFNQNMKIEWIEYKP